MCNRILLWLGKLPRWSRRHVSRGTFQSGLRFQTSLSSLRVSCKRTLGVSEYWEDINLANICLFIVKNWITRKKCEIMSKVNNQYIRTMSVTSFWFQYNYLLTYLTRFFSVLVVGLKQINICKIFVICYLCEKHLFRFFTEQTLCSENFLKISPEILWWNLLLLKLQTFQEQCAGICQKFSE